MEKGLSKEVSSIVNRFVNECNHKFPNLFLDFYVCGSQIDGSANSNSDLDMILVTDARASKEVQEKFDRFFTDFNTDLSPQIGLVVFELNSLDKLAGYAKNALHIDGQNCFAGIPVFTVEETIEKFIYGSFKFIGKFLRKNSSDLAFPVVLPDKNDRFFGYTLKDEAYGTSSKLLVSAIARFCGTFIALNYSRQPISKRDSIETFAKCSSSEFAPWCLGTYKLLARKWEYQVPTDEKDFEVFQGILKRFNEFENFFLTQIIDYRNQLPDDKRESDWLKECQKLVKLP